MTHSCKWWLYCSLDERTESQQEVPLLDNTRLLYIVLCFVNSNHLTAKRGRRRSFFFLDFDFCHLRFETEVQSQSEEDIYSSIDRRTCRSWSERIRWGRNSSLLLVDSRIKDPCPHCSHSLVFSWSLLSSSLFVHESSFNCWWWQSRAMFHHDFHTQVMSSRETALFLKEKKSGYTSSCLLRPWLWDKVILYIPHCVQESHEQERRPGMTDCDSLCDFFLLNILLEDNSVSLFSPRFDLLSLLLRRELFCFISRRLQSQEWGHHEKVCWVSLPLFLSTTDSLEFLVFSIVV